MRVSVVADNPLEWAALALGLAPAPLAHMMWGLGAGRCILAGVRLGLFDALDAQDSSAEDLSLSLGCSLAGTETLLNALSGFGYVHRQDGVYRLASDAQKWLVRSSDDNLVDGVLFCGDVDELLHDLEGRVREGRGGGFHERTDPEFWARYMRGLASMVSLPSKEIARRTSLPGPRVLDVGGGHGVFANAFAARAPDRSVTVLDLAPACEVGRRLAVERGYERVSWVEGDLRTADWGEGWDAVLLFSVVHNLTPEENVAAFARARSALRPGGRLVVFEAEHKSRGGDLDQAGGFSELLFFLTSGTRAYPEQQLAAWISDAGFTRLSTMRPLTAPYTVVLTATA